MVAGATACYVISCSHHVMSGSNCFILFLQLKKLCDFGSLLLVFCEHISLLHVLEFGRVLLGTDQVVQCVFQQRQACSFIAVKDKPIENSNCMIA